MSDESLMISPLPSPELEKQAKSFSDMHEVCRDIRFEHKHVPYRLLVMRYYCETGLAYTIYDEIMSEDGVWVRADLPDVHYRDTEEDAIKDAFALISQRFRIAD